MQEITRTTERRVAFGTGAGSVDVRPEARPGVPMEAEPRPDEGAHWIRPPRQRPTVKVLRRKGLKEMTPVFGTAQPPHGLSGLLRSLAYRAPEHQARHWAGLLLADRIDVLETRLGRVLGRRLRDAGFPGPARFLEANALAALAAGTIAAGMLTRRIARRLAP